MTVSLKHTFASAKADGTDASLIQPSNWNAEHQLTLATNKVLGRATAGTGAAEELSVGTALSISGGTLAVTTVPVANGGTGANTLTANNVLLGNGTSAPLTVAPGTNGNVLTSNGTTWVSQALGTTNMLSYLSVAGGGGGGSGRELADSYAGAGGGGGGVVAGIAAVTTGTLTISIGAGGSGQSGDGQGVAGNNTTLTGATAAVGGGGGGGRTAPDGGTGGSGGGGTI